MNMFKPTKAKSIDEYIESLSPERREQIEALHALIQKTSPKLKPHFATNMLGYGKFPCRNHKKEIIEWPVIALASLKNYISLYVCAVEGGKWVAEKFKKDLGKVSVGNSCIRFKNISDLDLKTLKKLIKVAEKNPGVVGAS